MLRNQSRIILKDFISIIKSLHFHKGRTDCKITAIHNIQWSQLCTMVFQISSNGVLWCDSVCIPVVCFEPRLHWCVMQPRWARPETPQIHYMLASELIFVHYHLRNLSLLSNILQRLPLVIWLRMWSSPDWRSLELYSIKVSTSHNTSSAEKTPCLRLWLPKGYLVTLVVGLGSVKSKMDQQLGCLPLGTPCD